MFAIPTLISFEFIQQLCYDVVVVVNLGILYSVAYVCIREELCPELGSLNDTCNLVVLIHGVRNLVHVSV